MAQSILIFDFGANEQAAQQARHKIEGWKQGFRLGNKILLKFERDQADLGGGESTETAKQTPSEGRSGKKKPAAARDKEAPKNEKKKEDSNVTRVRVLVRLDFSDHEKLSHQRWLDRIPGEEPFKSAKGETIRHDNTAFAKTTERFDSLV